MKGPKGSKVGERQLMCATDQNIQLLSITDKPMRGSSGYSKGLNRFA